MTEAIPVEEVRHPMLDPMTAMKMKKGKIVTAEEAIELIRDNDTIVTAGFVGVGFAEELAIALKERFLKTGKPRNLTFTYPAGQGDGKSKGLNHIAIEGLVGKIIAGHTGLTPGFGKLINDNKIFAYNIPMGPLTQLFRDIAAHKPGNLTHVGLGTFIDPREEGGKLNDLTKARGSDIVTVMTVEGKEYLFYKAFPIHVAFLRGTTADPDGNITMEKECAVLDALAMAQATRNSGGIVIVQVERLARAGTLKAREVIIPGILVDCVVVAKPESHWQTFGEQYSPAFSCELKVPMQAIPPLEMSCRKIVVRRAAFELKPNSVVNLGIGMPEGVSRVANEERILEYATLTTEAGLIGGLPMGGLDFGAGINVDALITENGQFDFYDGGGLDIAFLGMAETDAEGNVNVSKFGPRFTGPGGFIDITQNAKKVCFLGTFTAGGLDLTVRDGNLLIRHEGRQKKFVLKVEQKTFSGKYATMIKQPVLYITERCVFRLCEEGLELIEIAPGIDLETQVLALMDFKPIIRKPPKLMDPRIFLLPPMGIKDDLLNIPMEDRFVYRPEDNIFFINLENYYMKTSEEVQQMKKLVGSILEPIGKKVHTIANYDNFNVSPHLVDEYVEMVKYAASFYESVTRYTTSTFLKMKLGDELQKRGVAPHIYESKDEAHKALTAAGTV
ncbi:acyl CoA:acetate/3-ketoacid CoA transferase [Desulforhabdus sp. TSK]|uniref:acyl CoA:acetate/3-ketoacid CoA transferase n=1 Tax=Desulforhabdus sp. TSK TaxID=2925014 RepID=UPI001FC8C98D|nr:CoA-transferase [Desulforhabdus sp. TSK]GKT08154.1 acyl CoA:acetate/3-ketoacid CoA transferase [Desulforhabdus sp. TSK]